MKKAVREWLHLSPVKITVIYLIVAALWIVSTDKLLQNWISDPQLLTQFQTYKGWFYVIITSLGLYLLIRQHEIQIITKKEELKGVKKDYRSSRELKDILFERIPVMITIYDPDLNEFEVNREFEKVTGWSNKEAGEVDLLEASYPDLDQREEAVEFMDNPGVGWKEFTMTTKSGEKVDTSWTNVRLSDETSVGIGIDMTEIKAAEAELRESRELLRKTFDSLAESVILVDPETRTIMDCNSATEKIFGYSKEELVGESTRKLHLNDQNFREFDERGTQSLEEKGKFQTEFQMQKKDGAMFYSDHTVTLVYDDEGNVEQVVSVIQDITERVQTEKRVIRSVIEGEDRERKRIARELHDGIGQYLSASNMNLESVRENIESLSERIQKRYETGLDLLKKAIEETRDAAHNLMPDVLEDYGLKLAVETLIENIQQGTDVTFNFETNLDESELESQISVNIYRIIQEALNNAIKHGNCSTISIRLFRNNLLTCTIEDDGIGTELDEKDLKRGFGLRSMKTRIDAMSGTIDFDSVPGRGMTIAIEIPLSNPAAG